MRRQGESEVQAEPRQGEKRHRKSGYMWDEGPAARRGSLLGALRAPDPVIAPGSPREVSGLLVLDGGILTILGALPKPRCSPVAVPGAPPGMLP